MLIVQFTDTHVMAEGRLAYKRFDTHAMLARAVDAICALDPVPDLALATGDMVDRGDPAEYARLKALLDRLPMKLALIPGNHDARTPMSAAFDGSAIVGSGEFLHWVRDDLGPVRVVGVDSLTPGQVGGSLCDKRLAWLDATLAQASERPTLIALHHPPFPTGIAHIERFPFPGADAFERVVAKHRQIVRIVSGHLHRQMIAPFGGTIASVCPSTAYQFALDWREDAPAAWTDEAPGFQLHRWDGARLLTSTRAVGPFVETSLGS